MRTSVFALQGPLIAARDRGLFEQEGLGAVEYLPTRSSTEQLADLVAGRVDVAVTAADNLIEAQLDGRGVRVFHVADLGMDQFAVAGRGVRAFADVRGRAIGVDSATSGYAYVLYRLLADHDIRLDEVEVLELGGPAGRFAALQDGSVAAGMLNPFFTGRARADGLEVLAAGGERFPDYPNLVFAATEAALDADPAGFAAFARAVDAGVAWMHDPGHEDEGVALIAAERGIDDAAARRLYAGERDLRRVLAPDGAAVRRGLAVVAGLRHEFTGRSLDPEAFATAAALGD